MDGSSKNPIKADLTREPAPEPVAAVAPPTPTPTPGAAESSDGTAASAAAPEAPVGAGHQPAPIPENPGLAPIEERIVDAIKTVYDPEIPVNVYELGLIYDVAVDHDTGRVDVKMTLTSPACPVAGSLPGEVQEKVQGVSGVDRAEVELVWDPAWNPSMMSEAARLELGFF